VWAAGVLQGIHRKGAATQGRPYDQTLTLFDPAVSSFKKVT